MAEIKPFPTQQAPQVVAPVDTDALPTTLNCLLIPLEGMMVVLPNSAVAELVPYVAPTPVAGAPDWFLGVAEWRERRIPVVSFEAATGGRAATAKADSRLLVLNTLQGNPKLPYIAIVTQAIPRLQVLRESSLTAGNGASRGGQSVAAYVELGGQNVAVPDIDDLERRLMRLQRG
jgi:chemosensory pili system protein ChpC